MNYMSFMIAAIAVTPFLSKADVLISTSPQFFNGLAGYFVSRMKRIPWVLEIRDLWPESILAVGAIQNKWIIRLLEALEAFAYRKADRIVPVTDSFRGHIERRLIDPRKIEVIKNGVDLTVFKVGPKENPVARDLRLEKKFVAAYVGTHGMAHGLDVVLDAAKRLEGRQDIVFLLVGDGAEKARLVRKKEEMGLRNVVMLDQQPKEKMPLLWAACDVSLVLLRKHDLFKTVIPSKIFESMAMERPIVLGVLGESAEIVKDADAGVCVEPENSDELANVVIRLCDERERTKEMGMNGRKYVEQKFDRSVLARRFEELLAELVGA
jgi:glycosyltransferase involved in cell wall biosynthesis